MAPPGRRGPWPAVRAAVRRELGRASLRKLAADIEIDSTTLHDFVTRGTTPHARNGEKLLAWYNGLPPDRRGAPPERARVASSMILEGLEGEVRRRVLADVAARIAEGHAEQGTAPPEWVAWVREHGEPPADDGGGGEDGDDQTDE